MKDEIGTLSCPLGLLVCTVGLPRSGKTTWARDQGHPVVNPDAIRLALHGQRYEALAEPFVWAIAKTMVRALFLAGHHIVIVDATNTTRKRRDDWQSDDWNTAFYAVTTPAHVCIERAMEGRDDVILPVIAKMSKDFERLEDDETTWSPS